MKKTLLLLSLFTSLITAAQKGHEIDASFMSGGVNRTYRLYVPLKYDSAHATSVPLIMNFHGLGSTSTQQESYGDFRKIADTANFIVVQPQGLVQSYIGQNGWNNFFAPAQSAPDLNFTSSLIDTLKSQYNINLSRVYSTGMSNGGFMSYVVACQLSGRFAAVASVSGSMVSTQLTPCHPQHPMPLMEIHGTADSTVEYDGTGGIVTCTDIDSLIRYWVKFNHCSATPTIDSLPNTNLTDGCRPVHYVYSGGTQGSSVEFYKIIGGSHSWPGAPLTATGTNEDFSASKEIWRFFNQQKSFVGIDEHTLNNTDFSIYPNPTNGAFTISISNTNSNKLSISVIDILGKEVFSFADNNCTQVYNKQINLENVTAGIYFIRLCIGTDVKTKKLIIQ